MCQDLALVFLTLASPTRADELGEEGFAGSGGVKIHYVTAGKGPLVCGPTTRQ
jgi:hypothetical protein